MSFKASPDGTYGEILVNSAVVAKLSVSGNAVIPNLVGTVSQSGGIPTGAVVERGSNANGAYVRFADGTQICWNLGSASNPSMSAYTGVSGLYNVDITWTFPAAFLSAPVVASSGVDFARRGWTSTLDAVVSSCTLVYFSSASAPASTSYRAVAIGRWY